MMDGAGSEDHVPVLDGSGSGNGFAGQGQAFEGSGPADPTSLEALVAQIEQDPWECRQAFEGLESLDVATRVSVIEGLAGIRAGSRSHSFAPAPGHLGERRDAGGRAGRSADTRRRGKARSGVFRS